MNSSYSFLVLFFSSLLTFSLLQRHLLFMLPLEVWQEVLPF